MRRRLLILLLVGCAGVTGAKANLGETFEQNCQEHGGKPGKLDEDTDKSLDGKLYDHKTATWWYNFPQWGTKETNVVLIEEFYDDKCCVICWRWRSQGAEFDQKQGRVFLSSIGPRGMNWTEKDNPDFENTTTLKAIDGSMSGFISLGDDKHWARLQIDLTLDSTK